MEDNKLVSIRGAACAENTKESITEWVGTMCRELFMQNGIVAENVVNIHFSMTKDLDVLNPATALRRSDVGIDTSGIPLFTSQEAEIQGMLRKVVRVMITVWISSENLPVKPVYLNGAEVLRPDLFNK